jgi:molecular chaperone IbpA
LQKEIQPACLHRVIATLDFENRFQLADHVKTVSAGLNNRLLYIELGRKASRSINA